MIKLNNYYVVLTNRLIGGDSLPLRCNPTSSSDGPTRVKSKARRNTRSSEHKSGLRSKDTIDVMQQSQKDDCEGIYVPTKAGKSYTLSLSTVASSCLRNTFILVHNKLEIS